jgi:ribosome-associated protein
MERMSASCPSDHVIRGSVRLPEAELRWRFTRSSGPGGQHVNTTDTQVEARFDLGATRALPEEWKRRALDRLGDRLVDGGVLVVRASEHRSQWRNRQAAAARMAALLAEASAPPRPPRKPRRVPRAARERRLREKQYRSALKRNRGTPERD